MSDAADVLDGIVQRWPEIAAQLGLPAKSYKARTVRARLSEANPRIVVLLEGEGLPTLILKQNLGGTHINHFRNGIASHRAALAKFEDQAILHVPGLLFVDEDHQITVTDFAAGMTAHDALGLSVTPADRARVLFKCGSWIGHWHRATYVRDNPITPNAMQKFAAAQRDRARDGSLSVANASDFVRCSDIAIANAEAARGKITRLAATHGDMNLRNLIIGPQGTWGLDFGAIHTAPIGHDLARFFVNFGNFYYPDTGADDPTWFNRDIESFFAGYGEDARYDPSFDYLLRMQTLKDWSSIPTNPLKRNSLHKRRWKGLKILRGILFSEA